MSSVRLPLAAAVLVAAVLAGCGGGSQSGRDLAFGGPVENQQSAGSASAAKNATPHVIPKGEAPKGKSISVDEGEWYVLPEYRSAPHGKVEFDLTNDGTMLHELVVLKTKYPADRLPLAEATVDEEKAGTVVAKQEPYAALEHKTLDADLSPGHYVLFCNLVGHYQRGMAVDFTVK